MVIFKRQDTLGGGFAIEALNHKMLVGHIRKQPDTGTCRYYRGVHHDLTPRYENRDLEALNRWVRENPYTVGVQLADRGLRNHQEGR